MDIHTQGIEEEEIFAEADDVPTSNNFNAFVYLQSNAWFILIASLLLYYIWKSKLSHMYETWKRAREDEIESANLKKDPELFIARETARMAAVERLQSIYNEQALKMKEMEKEREEQKRREKLARLSAVVPGKKLNEGYNPLSDRGGPTYRAPRRSCPRSCPNR